MSTDDFLWYMLGKAYPEKMTIIEQLLTSDAIVQRNRD